MSAKIFSFFICFIFLYNGVAQTLNFKQFTTKEGLPSLYVYSVFQDSQGYIWVSTSMGIVKHNGQRFIPVCKNLPVKNQSVYAFCEGPDKHIYIATNANMLFRIQNDSAIGINATDIFEDAMMNTMVELFADKNGDLYFSSFLKTYRYIKSQDTVIQLSTADTTSPMQLRIKKVNQLFLPIRDNFRRHTDFSYSMVRFPGNNMEIKTPQLNILSRAQFLELDNYFYFSDGSTIYKIKGEAVIESKKIPGLIKIQVSPEGDLWLLTTSGIHVLNPQLDSICTHFPGKLANVCFDRLGGIWISTLGSGLYYCRDKNEKKLFDSNGYDDILSLTRSDNHFLFTTSSGDIFTFSNSTATKIHHVPNPSSVSKIIEMEENYVIGTRSDLFFLSKKNKTVTQVKDGENRAINASTLFLVAPDTLLCKNVTAISLVSGNKVINRYSTNKLMHYMLRYDNNHFLVSDCNGLWKYNWRKAIVSPFDTTNSGTETNTCIAFDQYRNLWVCKELDGFFVKSPDGKTTQLSNLPFLQVFNIAFYKNTVIVNSNMGIFKANFTRSVFPESWVTISNTVANGFDIKNNILSFTTEEGLLSFDLEKLSADIKYPIVISSILCNGKPVENNRVEFDHSENDLRFNIDFLNYRWPVNGFYFTLKGPTTIEGNIEGNILQIQNLVPGNYVLKIFPFSGNFYNKSHFLVKKFTIHPAYWQTTWFKVLYIFLIVFVTGLLVALFYNRKRKRDAQTAEVNKLLAEHTLTALKAQINPHFISNSLSAIQALIDSGEIDKANQYIAKFSLLIRYVLKYSDKSATRLIDELKIIDLNVELEQLRFTNRFVFSKQIETNVNINELFIPPLITQPFIENAIWHGLLPMKNGKNPELTLKIEEKNDTLLISIIDNGIGRKKASSVSTISNNPYKESKGTKLINERIHNLNQLHHANEARVEINDLYDEKAQAIGTHVTIILPLEMLNHLEEQK